MCIICEAEFARIENFWTSKFLQSKQSFGQKAGLSPNYVLFLVQPPTSAVDNRQGQPTSP